MCSACTSCILTWTLQLRQATDWQDILLLLYILRCLRTVTVCAHLLRLAQGKKWTNYVISDYASWNWTERNDSNPKRFVISTPIVRSNLSPQKTRWKPFCLDDVRLFQNAWTPINHFLQALSCSSGYSPCNEAWLHPATPVNRRADSHRPSEVVHTLTVLGFLQPQGLQTQDDCKDMIRLLRGDAISILLYSKWWNTGSSSNKLF